MDPALVRAIEEVRRLTVAALKIKYREVVGEEARSSSKQFLFRRIAWQLQVIAEGDVSERACHRAAEIAEDTDLRTGARKGFWSWPAEAKTAVPRSRSRPPRDWRLPQPGTLLSRPYQGREVVVKVLSEGFEYQARNYRSLSAIAREVTGTRWNGLLFFGLAERRHE
jgi:hypothetical protein